MAGHWRLLAENGIDLMQDPAQLVIVGDDQTIVVKMVYDGIVDVGFVRTNEIEGMQHNNLSMSFRSNVPTNRNEFFYLNSHRPITDDGVEFPFDCSTQLYPEWSFSAAPGIPWQLREAVQSALFNIGNPNSSYSPHVKSLAQRAAADGQYATFQPSSSYLELRTLQEQLGYITVSELDSVVRCPRLVTDTDVYPVISCPAGYFKRLLSEVVDGCAALNLSCPAVSGTSVQCICKPCYEAEEVEVLPLASTAIGNGSWTADNPPACLKMSVCALAEQNVVVNFTVIDNMNRPNANVTYRLQLSTTVDGSAVLAPGWRGAGTAYSIGVATAEVGAHLLEIFVDGEQVRGTTRGEAVGACRAEFRRRKQVEITNMLLHL